MLVHVNGKQPQHGIFNESGFLRASLANQLVSRMGPGAIRAMKRTAPKVVPKPAPTVEPVMVPPPPAVPVPVPPVVEPKEVASMLATVQEMKRQKEESDKLRAELQQKMDAEKARHEREKADYAAMMASKAEALKKMFDSAAPMPSEVLSNPLASTPASAPATKPQAVSSSSSASGVLRNAVLMRKLKNMFLRKYEEDPTAKGQDVEQVLGTFVKFLSTNLADKAPEAELNALLRKARYGLLGDMDLDGVDVETVVTTYMTYVANEAGTGP
jgi:hypothetical protein